MEARQRLAGRKDVVQWTEVYPRLLTALKEKFYPAPVKKTPAHFNQVKEGRPTKANSKTSGSESDESFGLVWFGLVLFLRHRVPRRPIGLTSLSFVEDQTSYGLADSSLPSIQRWRTHKLTVSESLNFNPICKNLFLYTQTTTRYSRSN